MTPSVLSPTQKLSEGFPKHFGSLQKHSESVQKLSEALQNVSGTTKNLSEVPQNPSDAPQNRSGGLQNHSEAVRNPSGTTQNVSKVPLRSPAELKNPHAPPKKPSIRPKVVSKASRELEEWAKDDNISPPVPSLFQNSKVKPARSSWDCLRPLSTQVDRTYAGLAPFSIKLD
jgi:hypothetical protein